MTTFIETTDEMISESATNLNRLIRIEKEVRHQEEETKNLCQEIDDAYHDDKHRKSRIYDTPLSSKIMMAVEKLTVERENQTSQ